MQKIEYVKARKAALEEMSTEDLAITIGEYFDRHKTMPGEKDLKKAAEKIVANIAENPEFEIGAEAKASMIETFAGIVVRELKVNKLTVKNVNKENKDDASVLKPTALGLVETGSEPAEDKKPAKKFYAVDGSIKDGKVFVGEYEIGSLDEGFVKNNPGVNVSATILATDYSNGKFANMSYSVVADIAA